MSDTLRSTFDAAVRAAEERSYVYGLLGRLNPNGTVTLNADRPGYVYVRVGMQGQLGTTTALNSSNVPLQAHMPVKMRREHGVLVIQGGSQPEVVAAAIPPTIFGVAKHHHRTGSGMEYEVETKYLEPGRVRPYSGLTVYINLFRYYTGTAWETWPGGTLDLTSYLPAASNWAWVLVGVDPSTNTAVAVKGADVPYATPLTIPDLDAIDFLEYIPCGAIRLRDDDTELTAALFAARFEDAHGWFNQGGGVSSHGDLTDLEIDDHAQYALLAGRSGGQHLHGGVDAEDDLTLESTAHATKGDVILQPNGGSVIIGNGQVAGTANLYLTQVGSSLLRINADTTENPEIRFMVDGSSKVSMGYLRSDDTFRIVSASTINSLAGIALKGKNVGIGDTAPNAPLLINSVANSAITKALTLTNQGTGIGTGSRLVFTTNKSVDRAFIQSKYTAGHDLQFGVGGISDEAAIAMTIAADGNVGIGDGATAPDKPFVVRRTDDISAGILASYEGKRQGSNLNVEYYHTGNYGTANSMNLGLILNTNLGGANTKRTAAAFSAAFTNTTDASRTSRLNIATVENGVYGNALTVDGKNLGINTPSPFRRIHVTDGDGGHTAWWSGQIQTGERITIIPNGAGDALRLGVGYWVFMRNAYGAGPYYDAWTEVNYLAVFGTNSQRSLAFSLDIQLNADGSVEIGEFVGAGANAYVSIWLQWF